MSKRDLLGLLVAATGGLLSLGDGVLIGVVLLVVSAYLLGEPRMASNRENSTGRSREFAR